MVQYQNCNWQSLDLGLYTYMQYQWSLRISKSDYGFTIVKDMWMSKWENVKLNCTFTPILGLYCVFNPIRRFTFNWVTVRPRNVIAIQDVYND